MRGKIDEALREEGRRLRVEERLSGKEIAERVGVSKGTVSGWLKDLPLTLDEVRKKAAAVHRGHPGKKKDRGEESRYQRMVSGRELTRQDKAKIAESAVLFRLCLNRFIVYGSPFDGDKADWLIESADVSGKTFRIQVKWAKTSAHGMPFVSLMCMEKGRIRRYQRGEFDFIVGYCLFNDTAYVYSFDEVARLRSTVSVTETAAEAWDKIMPVSH